MQPISSKNIALDLRKEGYSYTFISAQTGISKSTLSTWLSGVEYHPNQEMVALHGKAIAAANEKKVHQRNSEIERIKGEADFEIKEMNERDLFMYGLGLYLGEGSKTHDNVSIANSDPKVIKVVVRWNDIEESLHFWSETTSIPIVQFQKTQIDTRTNKKSQNRGKLPHGTLHIVVRSRGRKEFGVAFARRIQSWNENVLKKIQNAELV